MIAEAIADLTIAMLLSLAYRLVDADCYTRSGRSLQEHTIILAPHYGGAAWDARSKLTKATARQIVALIAGERPVGLVED